MGEGDWLVFLPKSVFCEILIRYTRDFYRNRHRYLRFCAVRDVSLRENCFIKITDSIGGAALVALDLLIAQLFVVILPPFFRLEASLFLALLTWYRYGILCLVPGFAYMGSALRFMLLLFRNSRHNAWVSFFCFTNIFSLRALTKESVPSDVPYCCPFCWYLIEQDGFIVNLYHAGVPLSTRS